jgi:hypothetical protein
MNFHTTYQAEAFWQGIRRFLVGMQYAQFPAYMRSSHERGCLCSLLTLYEQVGNITVLRDGQQCNREFNVGEILADVDAFMEEEDWEDGCWYGATVDAKRRDRDEYITKIMQQGGQQRKLNGLGVDNSDDDSGWDPRSGTESITD